MYNPARIIISWERMRELLNKQLRENGELISSERDLNNYMGNGRTSFSCNIDLLTDNEIYALKDQGFTDKWDGDIVLIVKKETYPGIYLIGEF